MSLLYRFARVAWLVLAVAAASWAVLVATEPVSMISSCEVVDAGDERCRGSLFERYGSNLVLILSIPVVLCVLPAVGKLRGLGWPVSGALLLGAVIAIPATDTVFATLAYFLPIGLLAFGVAAFQSTRRRQQDRAALGPE